MNSKEEFWNSFTAAVLNAIGAVYAVSHGFDYTAMAMSFTCGTCVTIAVIRLACIRSRSRTNEVSKGK